MNLRTPFKILDNSGPFPHPGLLGVNGEARQLALRHYAIYYEPYLPAYCICIDYKRDMFLLDWIVESDAMLLAQNIYVKNHDLQGWLYGHYHLESPNPIQFCQQMIAAHFPCAQRIWFEARKLKKPRKSAWRLWQEQKQLKEEEFGPAYSMLLWKDGKFDIKMCRRWQKNDYIQNEYYYGRARVLCESTEEYKALYATGQIYEYVDAEQQEWFEGGHHM